MAVAFVRQIGFQPGVQLNPLRDETDGFSADNSDQKFAIAAKLERGRIDKAFEVNRSNIRRKIGVSGTIRENELNEAYIHIVEALNKGAYSAIIHRMTTENAKLNYIVLDYDDSGLIRFTVSEDLPATAFILAIKHMECFNDGIKISIHADQLDGDADNEEIHLELLDKDDNLLFEFDGSLNPDAKDDYEESAFIENVVSSLTSRVEVTVGGSRVITASSGAYGRDVNGFFQSATSDVLQYFDEGGTAYTTNDYSRAKNALEHTDLDYAYISSGGSRAPAMFSQMSQLAFNTNRQLRWDIPGHYNVESAILFQRQLNLGNRNNAHLLHCFWSPIESNDPTGINGRGIYGAATRNIAYSCLRNAQLNAKGFAPKHYPSAGKNYPLDRTGIKQRFTPTEWEKSDLAQAKINPVLFERYNGGGRYVYTDSITMALTQVSYRKLIAVADMSTTLDDWITRFGKEVLQLPMTESIRLMEDFLKFLFEGAEASGWLDPSTVKDERLKQLDRAWQFEVKPDERRPADRMHVNYGLHYVGTTRQIFVTQTIKR